MKEPLTVEFFFDIGSPDDYLAMLMIGAIEDRTGVMFNYIPVLLGGIFQATGNSAPQSYARGIKGKSDFEAVQRKRFIARHNITRFSDNPFIPVDTLMLMRCAVAAQFEGVFGRYLRAAYHHMWVDPKKMDDPNTLRSAFLASGVDIDRLMARAQQADVKCRLIQNTNAAVARGAFGSPTFFVGDEMFFGKDRLQDVEEAIAVQSTGVGAI